LRSRQDWVDPADLADWLAVRDRQLAAGELVYIAHQLDFVGRSPTTAPQRTAISDTSDHSAQSGRVRDELDRGGLL
jgi:hypothetical protein